MRVFVTGATGLVGLAVSQELLRAGHKVLGLARSDAGAQLLTSAGVEAHRGSLGDLDGLKRAAAASEGVIHTAHNHDFVKVSREVAAQEDLLAVEAMGTALEGSGKPLVITAGMSAPTEDEPGNPSFARPSERATVAMAAKGIRSAIVRLPPSVHGAGDRNGLVPALIAIAGAKGVSAYIGDGQNRWSAVHKLDTAILYRLVLEKGAAGARYHAVAEEGIPTREIAEAIGRRLNLPVVSKRTEDAADHFGFLGMFFGRDAGASSTRTRETLGWRPTEPGLIQDMEHGSYFA